MTNFAFLADITELPEPSDVDWAVTGLERWHAAAGDEASFATAFAADPAGAAVLAAIFGNSPFLTHCALRDISFFRRLAEDGVGPSLDSTYAAFEDAPGGDTDHLMRRLRIARRRVALAVAAADITGQWPVEKVTAALSRFADAAVGATVAHLLRAAAAAGDLKLAHSDDPQRDSGLAIFGLGKLGADELNYSSDIDLMVLYDPEVANCAERDRAQTIFVRLARRLVHILQERTADGYVFRTDLRLRPDPGATPLAMSVQAAETYYEILGQNWERAAMIKARTVAGDHAVGERFITTLTPFIWRKHLDFASIQDIHSIKRQINARYGSAEIAVAGHNIKLGRGGIREIEFFAQTQQLIWGGRQPALRRRGTVDALGALAEAERIAPAVAVELTGAYRFLRRVEHRLQMINDAQTHSLPQDAAALDRLAIFLGYGGGEDFGAALTEQLALVERHYAELFEEAPQLAPAGNLVFTGTEDDPGTLATLRELGFADGAAVGAVVRGWHHGRFRALRSTRARQILTELMPSLLGALAKTANPDTALLRFNDFLARLPAGVQLFSLFYANPGLLDVVAEIMGTAPRMAERLSRAPALLDGVLSGDFYDPLPDAAALAAELDAALRRARDFEDVLEISRRWAHDREFQIGVQLLRGVNHGDTAGASLADIADAVLTMLLPRVEAAFAEIHGRIPGAGLAIVGMGNLGGRELTVSSDLDLTFIYGLADGTSQSDGAKPLPPSQYFTRLGQRLISALTALTGEGRLYEIDMRLRPSGEKGPIASEIESWLRYQNDAAWTWEHLALARARVIAGPPDLVRRIDDAIRGVLTRPRDSVTLTGEVADMRRRMDAEHHVDIAWKTKHMRGGLVDIEFIAEYLQLRHAADHPEMLSPNSSEALTRAGEIGVLAADDARKLLYAARLMRRIRGLLRLTVDGTRVEKEASEGLRQTLVNSGEADDFPALREKLVLAQTSVREIFDRLIGRGGAT